MHYKHVGCAMRGGKISGGEMLAAFVVVCMIAVGLYLSHSVEERVQAQVEASAL